MTIAPGVHQYLNHYKVIIPAGYINSYVAVEIKNENVVFEEMLIANFTYNVRVIKVKEGELRAFTVNGEPFGLICTGVSSFEAYSFAGSSLLPYQT